MKKLTITTLALIIGAGYAEAPLESLVVKRGSVEVTAVALPGPKKKVGLKIVNSAEADVQLEGRVVASSSKKPGAVADCRFTTTAPARSDSQKKIKCDTSGADRLEVVITAPASP
ncbi:hypothetical protein [Turneriella parva]|uniref:Uncharacterized protein n=1 Tax=Turneriella parva (strain ATCC BAA-1111 / DSM 21527 / NCTC 11395 / H) TaxID=869212 RepID=I4B4S9_TURPD|nr:hypothetical protein [Turneriella parva]AFM12286.1 hypothetical protein Turpa_1638 [Turneriella parva DSM 21527]